MPDNQNDTIQVSIERLITASTSFQLASQSVLNTHSSMNQTANSLIHEMPGILIFSSASLYELQTRWNGALSSLNNSLQTMSNNLNQAASSYQGTDQQAGNALTPEIHQ